MVFRPQRENLPPLGQVQLSSRVQRLVKRGFADPRSRYVGPVPAKTDKSQASEDTVYAPVQSTSFKELFRSPFQRPERDCTTARCYKGCPFAAARKTGGRAGTRLTAGLPAVTAPGFEHARRDRATGRPAEGCPCVTSPSCPPRVPEDPPALSIDTITIVYIHWYRPKPQSGRETLPHQAWPEPPPVLFR